MAGKRAAQRYAKALLSLASEQNQLDAIDADIRLIDQTVVDSKDLRVMLKSPIIKSELKQACLHQIFKGVNPLVTNLFEVLLQNKRINLLPDVVKAFIGLVDKLNNVTTAKVTTAVPLDADMEAKIRQKIKEITGDEATLVKHIDENILGGFVLRIDDLQYDASISGKLTSLQQKFKQSAYQ